MVKYKDNKDSEGTVGIKAVTCLHCHEKFKTWPKYIEHRRFHELEHHHERKLEMRPPEYMFVNR